METEKPSRLQAGLRSVFNATNLNATAAFLLSLNFGNDLGSGFFVAAIVLGTCNKYRSCRRGDEELFEVLDEALKDATVDIKLSKKIRDFLQRPQITAELLMAATAVNALSSVYGGLYSDPENMAGHLFAACAWGLGVAGDNALRNLDRANYTDTAPKDDRAHSWRDMGAKLWEQCPGRDFVNKVMGVDSSLRGTLRLINSNPSTYFVPISGFYALSTMADNDLSLTFTQQVLNGGSVAASFVGVAWSISQLVRSAKGYIQSEQVNDGVSNAAWSATNILFGVSMVLGGNATAAAAQMVFATSAIKSLFETRSANVKDGWVKEHSPS